MRCYLIALRKKNKLTQAEAARKLGISRSFYSMIELGQREPDIPLMKAISNLFNDDVTSIFFDEICHERGHKSGQLIQNTG